MRILLIVAAFFMTQTIMAQSFDKKQGITDDEIIYHGTVTFADLEKESEFKWLPTGYDAYEPDAASITYLKKELKHYSMVVLMGTWCEDSHNLLPKLYKVLRNTDYKFTKFEMYGLDRDKVGKYGEQEKYRVSSVPTVILFHEGEEIGRIVELVDESIEADLVAIIEDFKSE